MNLTPLSSTLEDHQSEVQILFGAEEKTGTMDLDGHFDIDLSQYHEVLSGELDEPLKIKTTCSKEQGYALLSEAEG